MSLLEIRRVHKDFGGLRVLTDINLSIEEGKCHSIIGPNGAGKSTIFNLITGKYKPSQGEIIFDGKDITNLAPHKVLRKGLARSFQILNIFPEMTVYQNIRNAILSKQGIRLNAIFRLEKLESINEETTNVLETLGLIEQRYAIAGELSYGQQRNLELGLTLATDPKLILLDEPTAAMSRDETKQTVSLIKKVTQGKTVVLVEHDMDVVFSISDTITVLHYGRIIETGSPEEIHKNARVKEAYLGKKSNA